MRAARGAVRSGPEAQAPSLRGVGHPCVGKYMAAAVPPPAASAPRRAPCLGQQYDRKSPRLPGCVHDSGAVPPLVDADADLSPRFAGSAAGGYRFATIHNTNPNRGGASCGSSWGSLPSGWQIAPDDGNARYVTRTRPWNTHCLAYSNGIATWTTSTCCGRRPGADCWCNHPYWRRRDGGHCWLRSGNSYRIRSCHRRLLIRQSAGCNAGYYGSNNNCRACPRGRYRETQGATVLSHCKACPAGRYGTRTARTSYSSGCDRTCPAGHYCPAATSSQSIPACPKGTLLPSRTVATGVPLTRLLTAPLQLQGSTGHRQEDHLPAAARRASKVGPAANAAGTVVDRSLNKIPTYALIGKYCDSTGMSGGKNCPLGELCGMLGACEQTRPDTGDILPRCLTRRQVRPHEWVRLCERLSYVPCWQVLPRRIFQHTRVSFN